MRSGSTWPPCRLPPRAESRPGSAQGSRWGQAGSHAPLRAPPAYLPHHLAASARHGPSPGQGRRRFRSRGVPAAAHGRAVARSRRGPLARIALHDHWLLTNHSRANLRVSRMKEAALLYTGGSATPACRLTNAARRVVPPRPELRTAPLVSTSTCLLHDPRSSPRVPASTSILLLPSGLSARAAHCRAVLPPRHRIHSYAWSAKTHPVPSGVSCSCRAVRPAGALPCHASRRAAYASQTLPQEPN